jgi:carbon-monoxide dehydrogenase medium subunit
LKEFAYVRPATLGEAIAAMQADGARALSGGTDLVPQLREGRRQASRIVDLKGIPALTDISASSNGGLIIGASASATRVARHSAISADYPSIAQSARLIGSLQVQNRASLGGNICNAAPSADSVPALLCHQATARIAGPGGEREETLEAFIRGPGKTSLQTGDLLLAIILPPPRPRSAAHYLRFTPRREMDIAIAGAAAWIHLDENNTIDEARIVLASVGPIPIRATSAEQALRGERPTPDLFKATGQCAAGDAQPISDTRGSAEYRRSLVAALTARALAACWADLIEEPTQS